MARGRPRTGFSNDPQPLHDGAPPGLQGDGFPRVPAFRSLPFDEQGGAPEASPDPRELGLLCLRFGIDAPSDHTLEEIGGHLSVTRERVRQIEAKALAKLRCSPAAPELRACYDA